MKKYWAVKNQVGSEIGVVAISESREGEEKAAKRGYRRLTIRSMDKMHRQCLKNYVQNNPAYYPAEYLG